MKPAEWRLERDKLIVDLAGSFNDDWPTDVIADELGVSVSTVNRVLRENYLRFLGTPKFYRGPGWRKPDDWSPQWVEPGETWVKRG